MPFKPFFSNKTVVITGASSGVGKATAIAFAKEGAHIVLAARGKAALDEIAAICEGIGVKALVVPTDTSKIEDVQQLAAKALKFSGTIDYWVNNAGVLAFGRFEEMPIEVIDQIIKTNLLGYMHGAHTVIPIFKRQGRGVLINNISIGGWMPAPYGTAYTASKFGIRGMVEGLQGEVSDFPDIHICALYPGFQKTAGIGHSANYSGINLITPPPAFDPRKLAGSIVDVAKKPKDVTYPDWSAILFKRMYSIAPRLIRNISAAGVRFLMKHSKNNNDTTGNVLAPMKKSMKIDGKALVPTPVSKAIGIAGIGIAAIVLLKAARRYGK